MKKIFQPSDCLSPADLRAYAEGKLTEDRRFRVENHLLDCPLCNEAVEGFQSMETIPEELFEDLYKKVDAPTAPPSGQTRRLIPWNNIAASLLFLLVAGAAYFYYQSNDTGNAYQAYFENQENSFAVRAIEDNRIPNALSNGLALYQDENYQASLSFFEDYLKTNPEEAEAAYYAGMSALHLGEREIAYEWLTTTRLNSENLYEEATWRLAGIHLARGEKKKAKDLLRDLTKMESGFFVERGKDLLEKLEKE